MSFKPVAYLKHNCPHCLKFMIYVGQAGIWDNFKLEIFEDGSPEHDAAKAKLAPHFDSVSFPTVEVAPGDFRKDSDALIAHYEAQSGKMAADMPLLDYYATGVLPYVGKLFRENKMLKEAAVDA